MVEAATLPLHHSSMTTVALWAMGIAGTNREYFSQLFAGDLRAFGGPSPDKDTAGQIRSEQIKIVRGSAPGMLIANACNAMVLAMALWTGPDRWLVVSWASVVVSAGAADVGFGDAEVSGGSCGGTGHRRVD